MVTSNAHEPNQTLSFDYIHRRDYTSEAINEYSPELPNIHKQFTHKIAESIMAKVEII